MSIQLSLVFGAMVIQMITLVVLLLPLPYPIRKKIIDFTFVLQKSQNFKVGVVFTIILLILQFLDCVNRLRRLDGYNDPYFTTAGITKEARAQLSYDQLATKFYSQRNLYLSGAVLYLMVAIGTVITIVRKLVKKETDYRNLLARESTNGDDGEIEKYKQLIKLKQNDIDTFKKQLSGLQSAYDGLNPDKVTPSKDD
ncbi:ER 25 kDa transmembrane protein [Scheffersomyces amazonensis]|uniref:ER 25 kDa transmembrane protein n=1 Tax=Scheffersomyces amazonensis TaxID=1078765 RepID=UPI00315CFD81